MHRPDPIAPAALRGLVFPVDGPVAPLGVRADALLADLYAAMHCRMVEVVTLVPGVDLWCDEEGLLKRPRRPNRCWLAQRGPRRDDVTLCGAVVALGSSEAGTARSLSVTDACEVLGRLVGAFDRTVGLADRALPFAALTGWLEVGLDWRS